MWNGEAHNLVASVFLLVKLCGHIKFPELFHSFLQQIFYWTLSTEHNYKTDIHKVCLYGAYNLVIVL